MKENIVIKTDKKQSFAPKKTTQYFMNAILVLISVCFVFIIAELFLRLNYVGNALDILLVDDPVLHHAWAPSIKYNNRIACLTTNRQSWLEEYDVTTEKPSSGIYRIFYLGDSNVQGHVGREDRMVEIVEKELNRKYAKENVKFEVINTGTSSYSCLQYYLLVKTRILKYAPDLVVLNIDMTDVVNDAAYRYLLETDQYGEITAVNPKKRFIITMTPHGYSVFENKTYFPDWLIHHSRLIRFIHVRMKNLKELKFIENQKLNLNADWLAAEWSNEIQGNVDFSMEILSRTIQLLKKHHVKVFVTGVPHYHQYDGLQSARPHKTLYETAVKNKVPYLNSYKALKDRITGTSVSEYYRADDPTHFNIKGNRIWAEAQLNFISDPNNGLLPPQCRNQRLFNSDK